MTTLLRQAPLPNQATRSEASETLDPQNWDEIRAQGHRMLDDMIDHIATVRARPVWQPIPDDVRARFREKLPRAPSELGDVYREFSDFIAPYATGNVHPGFMGWVHGGGSAVGMLAEMLAAGLNANLGGRDHMPIEVERQVVDSQRDLRLLRVTAPERSDSRHQFLHRKRFREIIVGAELQSCHTIGHFATRGQHQDAARHIFRAHSPQHFEAIHARQADVEHDQIERRLFRFAQG